MIWMNVAKMIHLLLEAGDGQTEFNTNSKAELAALRIPEASTLNRVKASALRSNLEALVGQWTDTRRVSFGGELLNHRRADQRGQEHARPVRRLGLDLRKA